MSSSIVYCNNNSTFCHCRYLSIETNCLPGGCSRFWYGGCEAGPNHYDTEAACEADCVEPRGAAVCYLAAVSGPCRGEYSEWRYNPATRACSQFHYGGCLGNGNRCWVSVIMTCHDMTIIMTCHDRFVTRDECEALCQPRPEVPVCSKPKAEGACRGHHPRWFYNRSK